MAGGVGRVMVFGPRGYLGAAFLGHIPGALASDADTADRGEVARALDAGMPDAVVNCAGRTGRPNVDWCEEHKAETLRSNVTGALVVADECLRRGVHLTHLSSGCIYDGDDGGRGWSEEDPPNFAGSFYARTKAWSDRALAELPVLVLRPRMPFDGTRSPRNLIVKLSGYGRVLDAPNSLTHLPGLLKAAEALIALRATGVFNAVNEGALSPYEVMRLYREIVDPTHEFEPLPADRLGEVARAGRSNCVLRTAKLRGLGLGLGPAQEALRLALCELAAPAADG